MAVKLLTKQHLEYLSLKAAAQARMSLHMLKYHMVGNHMSHLILYSLALYFCDTSIITVISFVSNYSPIFKNGKGYS